MQDVKPDSTDTRGLLEQVRHGDPQALERLLARYRPDLRAFVEARLDPKVRSRVDPSDVVQETQLEVVRRMADYLERRPMPFRLWVCKTAYERLLKFHRHHATSARRSVAREEALPEHSSLLVAGPLLDAGPSPSRLLADREFADRISRAVARLAEADREILLLRHREDLSYAEVGQLLDIEPAAARKRYGRALLRLRKVLAECGLLESKP
jgi:RNA polymerase sigma-70 factor (ECF subfamily)